MRNHAIKTRSIFGQRKAALRRWQDYRRFKMPACHVPVPDDDLQLFYKKNDDEGLKAFQLLYKIKHGVLVVPLSQASAHRASGRCKSHSVKAA